MERFPQEEYLLGHLDGVLRRGWLLRGVPWWEAESVREHSQNVANAALILTGSPHAYGLGIVHDLGELDGIDSTPHDKEAPDEKYAREWRNIRELSASLNGTGDLVCGLWQEYAEQQTPLARTVRDLDKIDAVVQAIAYDQQEGVGFALTEEFYASARTKVATPKLQTLLVQVYRSRTAPEPRMRYIYALR